MSLNLVRPSSESSAPLVLSIIIPFFNEHEVLPVCVHRLDDIAVTLNMQVELLFVDDGSGDGSAECLLDACPEHAEIRLIKLSRNFGKEAAMSAGLASARGDAVVILDADLQDPPEWIPTMVDHWRAGADVVQMQRCSRAGESWFKRSSAHAFYRVLARLSPTPVALDTGDFRLMSRRAVDALLQMPERNRYMKGLYAWIGLPTVVLQYHRAARQAGASKWRYPALISLAFEGITSFSVAPLRLATLAGLVTALTGMLFCSWVVIKAMVLGDPVAGYPSLVALITFLGGVQLLGIGIVGEYVGKSYLETKQRPIYLVQEERRIAPRALVQRASGAIGCEHD